METTEQKKIRRGWESVGFKRCESTWVEPIMKNYKIQETQIAILKKALEDISKEDENKEGLEACYILENIDEIIQTALREAFGEDKS